MNGIHYKSVALNGSGAGSDTIFLSGLVMAVRITPSSGTPTVVISDGVDTIITDSSISTTTYHPTTEQEDNTGTGQGSRQLYYVHGTVTITVSSGANNGSVAVQFKMVS